LYCTAAVGVVGPTEAGTESEVPLPCGYGIGTPLWDKAGGAVPAGQIVVYTADEMVYTVEEVVYTVEGVVYTEEDEVVYTEEDVTALDELGVLATLETLEEEVPTLVSDTRPPVIV
jgi:hypothetical protein